MTKIKKDVMNAITGIHKELKKQTTINWENRRYEIAKTILPFCCESTREILFKGCGLGDEHKGKSIPKVVAEMSVIYADALIEELKSGNSL